MPLDPTTLEALAEPTRQEHPLTYIQTRDLQAAYYQLRHEADRALTDASEDSAVQTILTALHGYERGQVPDEAFFHSIVEADATPASQSAGEALLHRIAFRMASSAFFYDRMAGAGDPAARRRLASSLIFQLAELNAHLSDLQSLQSAAAPAITLLDEPPAPTPPTPPSLLQMRLDL